MTPIKGLFIQKNTNVGHVFLLPVIKEFGSDQFNPKHITCNGITGNE